MEVLNDSKSLENLGMYDVKNSSTILGSCDYNFLKYLGYNCDIELGSSMEESYQP